MLDCYINSTECSNSLLYKVTSKFIPNTNKISQTTSPRIYGRVITYKNNNKEEYTRI